MTSFELYVMGFLMGISGDLAELRGKKLTAAIFQIVSIILISFGLLKALS